MGYDYSSLHVFTGDVDTANVRSAIVDCICNACPNRVSEDDATRHLVVGPPSRWIFVGDSAGSTEDANPAAFDGTAMALSHIAPTICVKMSDSAIVHVILYAGGRLIDKFGNGTFPWMRFTSEDEAAPFRGDVDRWLPYLTSRDLTHDLRQAWSQDGDANPIVERTARLLGIQPQLMQVGYSIFDEDSEIKYSEWLAGEPVDMKMFDEFHFDDASNAETTIPLED